ncbi:hypothetical protein HWI79_1832 [Cryptosporidium felis]|nr:hypothetical protein HWI79_1832 [Cryptosporidium felis]
MQENHLPHNELVWWRMTRKQRYLPGRVVILELEKKTVGIEEEHEKILRKLIREGSIIIHSFDDMKYAVCSSCNVKTYPMNSDQEQKSLEKDCIKSTRINYRSLLRVKKILELRKLDQVKFESNQINISPLEIRLIQYFKDRDNTTNLSESIDILENNTVIELLGSIVNRKTLKTMIGQSPQAFMYLDKTLPTNNKNILSMENEGKAFIQTQDSKQWQNELNEIIVNRKTICELLSCIPLEILSQKREDNELTELKVDLARESENLIINLFHEWDAKYIKNDKFIIEYIKLSTLYLRILSKAIALRVVNTNNKKLKQKTNSQYIVVFSLDGMFCDPYDVNTQSFIKLSDRGSFKEVNALEVVCEKPNLEKSRKESNKGILNSVEGDKCRMSFCFRTTAPCSNSDEKVLHFKVDLNRISSQLVVSDELQYAFTSYNKQFSLKELETRSKMLHVIKSSCPLMIKLLREWTINTNRGEFDPNDGVEQLKKIRENLLYASK